MVKTRKVTCGQCAVLVINNFICHERGCPDAWKDRKLECEECGTHFKPKNKNQICCTKSCERAYRS